MISVQHFVSAAVSADRVLVGDSASGDPVVVAAKYSLQDRAVMFLSNIPLLKNTEFVKSYIEKLNSDNSRSIGVFLNALSKCFGAKAATGAAEAMKKSDVPINTRAIRQMLEIAENIYGRGDAKNANRQVIVRIWPQLDMNHVGHASLTIKNMSDPNPKRRVSEHVSWWPGEDGGTSNKERYFKERKAISLVNYRQDKENEIADRTARLLGEGAEALKEIKRGNDSPEVAAKAKYRPRVGQKVNKDGNWGVSAQKIFVPMAGMTKDAATGKKSFVMFGLNERRILADAKQVKADGAEGKIGYTLASKTQNCAAMAARMLKSGGSENFSKFQAAWVSEGPNNVHAYAKTVQVEIDALNRKFANMEKRFSEGVQNAKFKDKYEDMRKDFASSQSETSKLKQRQQKTKDPGLKRELDAKIKGTLEAQVSVIAGRIATIGVAQSKVVRTVLSAIENGAPSAKNGFDTLTLKAKNIVLAMDVFLDNNPDLSSDLDMMTLLLGRTMLDKIKDFIKLDV